LLLGPLLLAQLTEPQGLQDLPLLTRYQGSLLIDGSESNYAELELMGPRDEKTPRIAKGKAAWRTYVAPEGRTAVEVIRNYEAALVKAGFKPLVTCVPNSCNLRGYNNFSHWIRRAGEVMPCRNLRRSYNLRGVENPQVLFGGAASRGAAILAERKQGGRSVYAFAAASENPAPDSLINGAKQSLAPLGLRAYTFVMTVEEEAAETGMVSVLDAAGITQDLEAEGRAAFYALYFDTGKAELKPESKPQLDQIAAVLKAKTALQVYVVGHTDSVGALDANLDLSRRRGQAVATALTTGYGIAATRLSAQAAGPLAPVASNSSESGRARNRRVELVVR
jgi:outer membrane protein OmpA-like peptidoglycan-associated protein